MANGACNFFLHSTSLNISALARRQFIHNILRFEADTTGLCAVTRAMSIRTVNNVKRYRLKHH